MRISTANAYDTTVEQLTQRQSALSDAQLRLTSGKRVTRASDDPISAARAERALASVSRATASQRSVEASRLAMTQIEGALGSAGELLQSVRDAIVNGGNASYGDSQRKMLADQIRGLRSQLLGLANSKDGAGGHLFGGQGSIAPPFLDAAGGVQYVGARGETSAGGPEGLPMTMDGAAVWMSAPTGNGVFETRSLASNGSAWIDAGRVTDPAAVTGSTYRLQFATAGGGTTYSLLKDGAPTALTNIAFVSGQAIQFDGMAVTVNGAPTAGDAFEIAPSNPTLTVFDVLDQAAYALATPMPGSGAKAQATAQGLRDIDSVLARLSGARATAGEALNRIDSTAAQLDSAILSAKTERSAAEDLDMPSAISDFQSRQTSYDAALKTYASVQRLSLFDYIRP